MGVVLEGGFRCKGWAKEKEKGVLFIGVEIWESYGEWLTWWGDGGETIQRRMALLIKKENGCLSMKYGLEDLRK